MKHFIVRYLHTDLKGWQEQLVPHLIYLKEQIEAGHLLMSGPLQDSKDGEKEAILIFHVESREELQRLIELDPYWTEGLVADYHVNEWNPMFGMLGLSPEQIEAGMKKMATQG